MPKQKTTAKPLQPLNQSRIFRALLYSLLSLLLILIASQVRFIFRPVVVLVSTLFLPILLAGIAYYLVSPLVRLLQRIRLPKLAAIILVYLLAALLVVLALVLIIPVLSIQLNNLMDSIPVLTRAVRSYVEGLGSSGFLNQLLPAGASLSGELSSRAGELVSNLYLGISSNLANLASFLTNLVIVLTTVPFVLFFMLKDGHQLPQLAARLFPDEFKPEAVTIMDSMGATLGTYIKGQMLVSAFVGVMVLIGYSIIGIDYALLLALVALVTNLIPYIGPIIGTIPGMVVGLMHSPAKMVQVLILVVIIQQVESQLISPLVMGKKLRIHPLIIIFLLLTAGSLAGFFGLLLAVPGYAVAKTAISHLYRLYRLRKTALSSLAGDSAG